MASSISNNLLFSEIKRICIVIFWTGQSLDSYIYCLYLAWNEGHLPFCNYGSPCLFSFDQVHTWWWDAGLGCINEPLCRVWFQSRNRYLWSLIDIYLKSICFVYRCIFHFCWWSANPLWTYLCVINCLTSHCEFLTFVIAKAAREGLDSDRQVCHENITILLSHSYKNLA